jgi:Ca2+-transporting ATPase
MRIVKAFKANGKIVAMTGDGVNDAAALKYADIGVAMGSSGSEVSREAADLILLDDNFGTIVETIKDGRRIYDNIQKAIGYVFTIHIPIAFASLLAPLLGIGSAALMLLPLHVVLLELVIDPTCSIVLERQPAEQDVMKRLPRKPSEQILTKSTLLKSFVQGIVIFLVSFGSYYSVLQGGNDLVARTMGIGIIIFANLFLVIVNSSNILSAFQSAKLLSKDKVFWAIIALTMVGFIVICYSPLNHLLRLAPLSLMQFIIILGMAFVSVYWYELVKLYIRLKTSSLESKIQVIAK